MQTAFKRLKLRASPGKAGLHVPALPHLKFLFVSLASPPLRAILQSILRVVHLAGREPPLMSLALLCPIYKHGEHSHRANYRLVVVSSILHKLYANCLAAGVQAAHTSFNVQHGELFPRQACFLLDRSTLHNMFCCVSTDHVEMATTLLSLEFPEHLVRGIAGMYHGLQYQVVTNGVVATPFPVGVGVKQGCPLSPVFVQPLCSTTER